MAVMRSLRSGTPPWAAAVYVGGLTLVFAGERVLSTIGWLRLALTATGVVLVVAITVLRWVATGAVIAEQRAVERALALLSTGGALAVALYFTTADPLEGLIGIGGLPLASRHRYESVTTVVWVALVLGTLLPILFAERALLPMRRSTQVEWRRVREALTAGLILALAATYGALFTFVAAELDLRADFSYFQTARPSESTRKLAASAGEPVEVTAFFPDVNAVGVEVSGYLRDLARGAPAIHVQALDRLLVPDLAKKAGVLDDGVVVIQRGAQKETLPLGVDIAAARPKLKVLDADFQKLLLKVLRTRKNAYFTVGHGELNDAQPSVQNEGRTGRGIREMLDRQNYLVRDLGAATGLLGEVPEDASIVLVIGPQQPFMPEEVATLDRYAKRGGRLFLCLDPQAKVSLQPLADIVGLRVSASLLANDKVHLRRRFNESDQALLVTNRYSSHPAVSTLSRFVSRPLVLPGVGFLEQLPGADRSLHVDFAVRALPDSYNDENGNFAFDPPAEKRQAYAVAAAVSRSTGAPADAGKSDELRAFVLADADAVSDAALGNEANALLVADTVRWLGGEESIAGAMSTTEDVRIEHTKQKDLVWFYGTIFAAPVLVLGGGLLYTRRSRRSKRARPESGPPRGPVQESEVPA